MIVANNTSKIIIFTVNNILITLNPGESYTYDSFNGDNVEIIALVKQGLLTLYDEDDNYEEDIEEELENNIEISEKLIESPSSFTQIKFNTLDIDEKDEI